MKLAIMQPYLFPYIGYYQAIHAADKYILYDKVNYIKQGYVNRNRYLVANGKPAYFSVAVSSKYSFNKISQVETVNYAYWAKKFLQCIYYNYKKCKYFDEIYNLIKSVVECDTKYLSELNARSILYVSRYLDINTNIVSDVSFYGDLEGRLDCEESALGDKFKEIKLENYDKKIVRIIEICRIENAHVYINAIGGKKIYSKEEFLRNNLNLCFVKTGEIKYEQRSQTFYPNLSIIDVLMNCGKDKTKELVTRYSLI